MYLKTLTTVLFATLAFSSTQIHAQGEEGYEGYSDSDGNVSQSNRANPTSFITPSGQKVNIGRVTGPGTTAIVNAINAASDACRKISPDYYIDCLGERLDRLADQMPAGGDYGEAQAILENAGKKLRALAKKFEDKQAPKVKIKLAEKGKPTTSRAIIATKKSARAEIKKEASAILLETETLLLRSAQNSEKRRTHYEQIAQAVGSTNKVLLRSL